MKKLVILVLFLKSLSAYSQSFSADELYSKIVLLYQNGGTTLNYGTGFLVGMNDRYFLITAKHVADSLKIDLARIFFKGSSNEALGYAMKSFLRPNSKGIFNDKSDFFLIELFAFDSVSHRLLTRSSFDINIIAGNRGEIPREEDLVVFGYPIFDFEHFSPVTFKSNFSSGLLNIIVQGFEKPCYCYLLENPGMEGFSGGPVIVGVKGRTSDKLNRTFIIGIVSATSVDKTGGKYAVVTPTFHLLDLLRQ